MIVVLLFAQADAKLKEEEKRALRYLETRRECNSVEAVSLCGRYLEKNSCSNIHIHILKPLFL